MGLEDLRNLLSDAPQSILADATSAGYSALLKQLSDTNVSPAAAGLGAPAQVTKAVAPPGPLGLGASGNVSPSALLTKQEQPKTDPWYVTYRTHLIVAGAVLVGYLAFKKLA